MDGSIYPLTLEGKKRGGGEGGRTPCDDRVFRKGGGKGKRAELCRFRRGEGGEKRKILLSSLTHREG